MHADKKSAQQCPSWWHPALHCPTRCPCHQSQAEYHSPKGMTEDDFPGSKENALCGKKLRTKGRPHVLMKCFKVLPEHRRGIGEAAVRKRIGHQEVAELIVDR